MPRRSSPPVELLQGALDLIVLRTLATLGPLHAYGIASRLEQVTEHPLHLNQGTLYPALVRLEDRGWTQAEWRTTENGREAKYYSLTAAGAKELARQTARWQRLSGFVNELLGSEE